jgi:hypothetical protein
MNYVVSVNMVDVQILNCSKLAMSLLQRRETVPNAEYHKKHINTFCGQNSTFLAVPSSGTYNYHFALKGE